MDIKVDKNTLIMWPCCKIKQVGGIRWQATNAFDLSACLSSAIYARLLGTRQQALRHIQAKPGQYLNNSSYHKNRQIVLGPDFGGSESGGAYLPSINRYGGHLYQCTPHFAKAVAERLKDTNAPKVLILSALYGPMHPLELIQDYNLIMSDAPAKINWFEHLPAIMEDFVCRNGIRQVLLYMGRTTAYLQAACKAFSPLLAQGQLDNVIYFNVVNGTSRKTPTTHGKLIYNHLMDIGKADAVKDVETFEMHSASGEWKLVP